MVIKKNRFLNKKVLVLFSLSLILLLGIFLFNSVNAFAGGSGTEGDPYQISNCVELQSIENDLTAHYVLNNNINCSNTTNWNDGLGFIPVGNSSYEYRFTGTFDGQNYNITDLYINSNLDATIGLFGFLFSFSEVKNVGLIDINITAETGIYVGGIAGYGIDFLINNSFATGEVTGDDYVGGFIGSSSGIVANSYSEVNINAQKMVGGLAGRSTSKIVNSYATGNIEGIEGVGGLVGFCAGGNAIIINSYATGNVKGGNWVGGLAGELLGDANLINSYATGEVTGDDYVGGLLGYSDTENITHSYAIGNVTGNKYLGGLIGSSDKGYITDCYATGNVTGNSHIGGLVGEIYLLEITIINNSYSTGNVAGGDILGGLVGEANGGGGSIIINSYATGNVTGDSPTYIGGFVGWNRGGNITNSYSKGNVTGGGLIGSNDLADENIKNSFWDINTSGQNTSDGGTGKNTTEMYDITTYNFTGGWDILLIENFINETWYINNSIDYPRLGWVELEYEEIELDIERPTYSNINHNNTIGGQATLFSVCWDDNLALHPNGFYWFNTNNTGEWVYDDAIYFTITPECISTIKILNSTDDMVIGYYWDVYDNENNYFITNTTIIIIPDATPPEITTSLEDGDVITYWGGEGINATLTYNITEPNWAYANYSISYPNGSILEQNTSSLQDYSTIINFKELGTYQWVLYANDTLGNEQWKTINFIVDLDSGGGEANPFRLPLAMIEEAPIEEEVIEATLQDSITAFAKKNFPIILLAIAVIIGIKYGLNKKD